MKASSVDCIEDEDSFFCILVGLDFVGVFCALSADLSRFRSTIGRPGEGGGFGDTGKRVTSSCSSSERGMTLNVGAPDTHNDADDRFTMHEAENGHFSLHEITSEERGISPR